MKLVFKASYKIKGRKLIVTPEDFKQIERWHDNKEGLVMSIDDMASKGQNDLLHVYFAKIADYTGDSAADIKTYLKHKYLGYDVTKVKDEEVKSLRRTRDLSMADKAKFISDVEQWAWHELNMQLSEDAGVYKRKVVRGYLTQ